MAHPFLSTLRYWDRSMGKIRLRYRCILEMVSTAMVILTPVTDSVSLWEDHEYWELRVQKTVLSKLG
jgi:hypothetical protein